MEAPTPFEVSGGTHTSDRTAGLHYAPARPTGITFVFAHGAGAGQRHPFMVTMATGLAARGLDVVTFDFPYVHAGRKLPDKAPVLESCFRAVCETARARIGAQPLVIGGKSMGGRIATHLGAQAAVADGQGTNVQDTDRRGADASGAMLRDTALRGIVALGYPLHPPGKPAQLRTSHLPQIQVPVLIVQGDRDAFGSPDELRPFVETMPVPVTLHVIPGGDHSFVSKAIPRAAVYETIGDVVAAWLSRLA
jgi:predicted alpha/beta-hydrolase family hydrolase